MAGRGPHLGHLIPVSTDRRRVGAGLYVFHRWAGLRGSRPHADPHDLRHASREHRAAAARRGAAHRRKETSRLMTNAPRSLSDGERRAWLRLARTQNVGPVTFAQLIARFGSASEALKEIPRLAKRGGGESLRI